MIESLKNKIPVMVNFHMPVIYGWGPGHHSPVVAYNPKADRFLLLDVACSFTWV